MLFSVLIPTYNRSSILVKTLQALKNQTLPKESYEVAVIDDGSTDDTAERVREIQRTFTAPFFYYYQANKKQGTARNLGAHGANGDYLLFLGDDIVPTPSFLEEHANARQRYSEKEQVVIGYTTWPESFKKTRFLEFIGEMGWQFGYSLIKDPQDVPFNYFYTSNLSVSREFFLESGGFDEDFKEYGWEDIELSLRLKKEGMTILYWPEAKAHHHHFISVRSFMKRQHTVGLTSWNLYKKHPETLEFLNLDRVPRYSVTDHLQLRFLSWACQLTESWPWPDLSRYYPDILSYHYLRGVVAGRPLEAGRT